MTRPTEILHCVPSVSINRESVSDSVKRLKSYFLYKIILLQEKHICKRNYFLCLNVCAMNPECQSLFLYQLFLLIPSWPGLCWSHKQCR